MKTTNLIEEILSRISKEYGLYNGFKKSYDRERTLSGVKIALNHYNNNIRYYVDIEMFFMYDYWFFNFLFNKNMIYYETFRNIIFDIINANIEEFLNKENINELINYNIKEQKYLFKHNLCSNHIHDLIEKLKNCENISPFDIVVNAFRWDSTKEKHAFWDGINIKFKKFLLELLFM